MDIRTLQALASGQLTSLEAKYRKMRILGRGSFGVVWLVQERSPSTAAAAPTNRRSNSRDGRGAVVVPDRRGAVRSSSANTRGLAPAQFVAKEITVVSANPNIAAQLREIAAKEVRVLSHLNHEHIVQYVEQVTEAEKTFIVMEYCAGGDLKSFLAKRKADGVFLKENEVLSMFRQLLRGVAYLHDQHLIHRDIKAANIFLSASGRLKLGDFGLTKDDMATHGLANTVCGTPMYYSPEMCRRVSYDFKTDLWALGCVFYEIMALNHPFEGVSLKDLPKRIINLDYADPNPGRRYNAELSGIISQFMLCPAAARLGASQLLSQPALQRAPNEAAGKPLRPPANATVAVKADAAALAPPNGDQVGAKPDRDKRTTTPPPMPALHDPAFVGREARLHRLLSEARNDLIASIRDSAERRKRLADCDKLIAAAKCRGQHDGAGGAVDSSTQRLVLAERIVMLLGDRCSQDVFHDVCVVVGLTKPKS